MICVISIVHQASYLENSLIFFRFEQIIKSRTRVTDRASSLINLMLVAEDVKTTNTNVIEISNDSVTFDHCRIMTDLVIDRTVNKENVVLKRNLYVLFPKSSLRRRLYRLIGMKFSMRLI